MRAAQPVVGRAVAVAAGRRLGWVGLALRAADRHWPAGVRCQGSGSPRARRSGLSRCTLAPAPRPSTSTQPGRRPGQPARARHRRQARHGQWPAPRGSRLCMPRRNALLSSSVAAGRIARSLMVSTTPACALKACADVAGCALTLPLCAAGPFGSAIPRKLEGSSPLYPRPAHRDSPTGSRASDSGSMDSSMAGSSRRGSSPGRLPAGATGRASRGNAKGRSPGRGGWGGGLVGMRVLAREDAAGMWREAEIVGVVAAPDGGGGPAEMLLGGTFQLVMVGGRTGRIPPTRKRRCLLLPRHP